MPRSKPCLGLNPECADRWPEFISHDREVGGGGKRGLNIYLGRQATDRFHARIAVHA